VPYQSRRPMLDADRSFDPFCLSCYRVFYYESDYVCRHDRDGVLYWSCIGPHIQPDDDTSPRYEEYPADPCEHDVSRQYACPYCTRGR
jgi:hypothetical protein